MNLQRVCLMVFKRQHNVFLKTKVNNSTIRISSTTFSTETNSKKETKQESQESKPESQESNKLEEEITKLTQSVQDFKEKYQRSLAETENVRMRLRKEVTDSKSYGIQSFCKDLLTVADVLKMAVDSIPKDQLTDNNTPEVWKSFYKGVVLTDKEMHKVFERHGLVVVNPEIGDKFNPNDHEALFEVPSHDLEPGHIAHLQRIGYRLKQRTIRPPQVGVSKTVPK